MNRKQHQRKESQPKDEGTGGCCFVFNISRHKKVRRYRPFRRRAKEKAAKNSLPIADGRKGSRDVVPKLPDPATGATTNVHPDIPRTSPTRKSVTVEIDGSHPVTNEAIKTLNETIDRFCATLDELAGSGFYIEHRECMPNKDVPLESRSLEDGIELIHQIIQKVTTQQMQDKERTLERENFAKFGRCLMLVCEKTKPVLKHFLTVAVSASNVTHASISGVLTSFYRSQF